jgi:hypothetical protein
MDATRENMVSSGAVWVAGVDMAARWEGLEMITVERPEIER